jgi:hypothetical protein
MIMSARILEFPKRGVGAVRVIREDDWLVIFRGQGWPFSSRDQAIAEANRIAAQFGVTMVVEAP